MIITLVVSMCHALAGITSPVCHEVIVIKDEMPMQACMLAQPALAGWKEKSIYAGKQWTLQGWKCVSGEYNVKDAA